MLIVTAPDNPGKGRVTKKYNSTRNSSSGTERIRTAQSHLKMFFTCRVSKKLHKQKTQNIAEVVRQLETWRLAFSPVCGHCSCEAHSTEVREKTEDSLSVQQNAEKETWKSSRKILGQVNRTMNIHITSTPEEAAIIHTLSQCISRRRGGREKWQITGRVGGEGGNMTLPTT